MNNFIRVYAASAIRHALTFCSGWLVAKGVLAENNQAFISGGTEVLVGLAAYALGQGASWIEKRKR